MSEFVIEPPKPVTLPVQGSGGLFPVRRVYCIGRNYAAHAVEMGHDPDKEPPFFFQKNPDNLVVTKEFPYPAKSEDVHFEAELAVALKSGGTNIPVGQALEHVYGYGVALDMTRRDLQGVAKKMGRPWEIGKAFEKSAPITPLVPAQDTGSMNSGTIKLTLNGGLRQDGDLNQMIWKIPEMISYLSEYFELAAGDVILTGTPAGVGAVEKGDRMVVTVDGLPSLEVTVV
ncbi:fumarylacetoacetate hydrolase family protein [Roseibium aggregatum]|uniref:Fumarylacetoacetate hydrolase family protein n=1 Tax=Roseibium aggregatum TaxID=187304 RepID=A0A939EJ41_9HYPH|nr:fumarylacetoacetate hydrolase family protein [Roseibium aggregatum]MBN9673641.1 fumarylacetoacetate hydrolase family protein [Roseibium aggregatum]